MTVPDPDHDADRATGVGGEPRDDDELGRRCDQVVAALDLLARGEFARCAICGTRIDDRRLQIAPDVDRCLRHIATTVGSAGSREMPA